MPDGLFDGGNPVSADAIRIAKHLVGKEPLSIDEKRLADLDTDGDVSIVDLHALLRIIAGELDLPVSRSRIVSVEPVIARRGQSVTVRGGNFGTDSNSVKAVLFNNDLTVEVPVTVSTEEELSFTVPDGAPLIEESNPVFLYLLRQSIPSNHAELVITDRPIINDIEPPGSRPGDSITISGKGFGSSRSDARLFYNEAVIDIDAFDPTEITFTVPGDGAEVAAVNLTVNDKVSNSVSFYLLKDISGHVVLPPDCGLDVSGLTISSSHDFSAPVSNDGSFTVTSKHTKPVLLEVQDAQNKMVLGGVITNDAVDIDIDMHTTAAWLVYYLSGGMLLTSAQSDNVLQFLATSPEVGLLSDRLVEGYRTNPLLFELCESSQNVIDALTATLDSARAHIHSIRNL